MTRTHIISKIVYLAAVVVLVTMAACVADKEEPAWSLAEGDLCPEFAVTLADGTPFGTSDMEGKTSVITFFNTGCADCRRELPKLQAAFEQYAESGEVQFICIAREQEQPEIEAYWQAHGLTLPYSPQSDRRIYSLFAGSGIPRIYVVGPDLRILEVKTY